MNRTTSAGVRRLAVLVVLGVLGSLLPLGLGAARPAPAVAAGPVAITEGAVTWGIKESWRRYIGAGSEAGDGATVTGRTAGVADGFRFPVASGSFDPETATTTLELRGFVHFRAWYEYHEPGKWALDTKFSDLRLVIDPDVQEIRGTHTGYLREDPGGDLHEDVDVVIARLDVGQATTDFTGGTASWSDLPAIAGPGFSIYTEGTPLDRVAFGYTGPGGVPDLGEHFDRPGVPVLKAGAEWLSRTTERSSAGGGQALELSAGNDVVFALNISHTSAKTVFVTAHDPVTLAQVGEAYAFQPGARTASARARLVHAFDPDRDTLFFQTFREGAETRDTTVRSVHWDAASRTFTAGVVGTLTPRPTGGTADLATGPMVWNRVTQELLVTQAAPYPVANVLEQDNLFRFARDGSGWTRAVTPLRFPDTGAYAGITSTSSVVSSTAVMPRQNIGFLADGSYLVATGSTKFTTASGSEPWPALRVRFAADGTALAEPVAGTIPRSLAEDFGGAYYGFTEVTPGADASLVLHGDDQSLDAFVPVRLVEGAAVAGEMAVGTDVLPPHEISVLGSSMAYDAAHDVQWAYDYANTEGKPLGLVEDGKVVASYAVKDFASAYFFNQYLRVAEDGAVYVPIADVTSGRFGWRRYAFLGVAPSVTQQPADASVELGVGEPSKPVAFTAAASGGDLQWQVRNPGESRFTDLPGEHGPTLSLAATASYDGRAYRLLVTNDAGRVASTEATLTVRSAPRVTTDLRDVAVTEGADASFVVAADANPAPAVTWQRRVAGFWQDVAADDDNVVVETVEGTSSLRVTGTNTDQSGSLFRARLRNDLGTVFTRAARLTVQPKVTIPADGLSLEGVVLEWSGSAEVQAAPPFGGSNYLSAGVSDGDEATYRVTEGEVTVLHRAPGGAETAPTWGTRAAQVGGGVEQLVRLAGGRAELAADGSGTIAWDGTWSVNFYGGLVPFWLSDPELRIDADGSAKLVADLDGYGSSQGDPETRSPLEEVEDVTVATFTGVEVDPAGRLVVEPEYAGREVTLPATATPQSRTGAGWGAWPQEMVDFQLQTGLSSYWYSSGGAADTKKAPSPVVVDLRDAERVTAPEPEPEPVDATVRVSLADSVLAFNRRPVATVRVTAPGVTPTGVVGVRLDDGAVVRARLVGGTARVVLPGRPAVGRHAVTASYAGDEGVRAGTGRTTLSIVRVLPRVTVVAPRKVRKGAVARVEVRVVVPGDVGASFRGQVAVVEGGRVLAVRTVTAASGATVVLRVPRSTVRRLRAGVHYWSALALATPSTLRATSRLVPVRVRR